MSVYEVPLQNGEYLSENVGKSGAPNRTFYHQVSFEVVGSPTAGTIEIQAKSPASNTFETIPDGLINLASPETLLFQFNSIEYKFIIAGSDVTIGSIFVSDQKLKGVFR